MEHSRVTVSQAPSSGTNRTIWNIGRPFESEMERTSFPAVAQGPGDPIQPGARGGKHLVLANMIQDQLAGIVQHGANLVYLVQGVGESVFTGPIRMRKSKRPSCRRLRFS